MENATKALLIAGSVLIVITLVGLGIGILSRVQEPTKQSTTTAKTMEVSIHNSQFEQYSGTNVNIARVKELLRSVKQNNKDFTNGATIYEGGIYVKIDSGVSIASQSALDDCINTGLTAKTYTVQIDYSDTWSDGRIKTINVTANN